MNVYVWLISLGTCFALTQADICKGENRCRTTRTYHMKGTDCTNREIREFPQCLPTDLEIIDVSYNRIRKLGKHDLSRYSNLKMLYLSDNLITRIDEGVFEGQDSLTTLDLSLNALPKLPPVVFNLPSLTSLYLSQNLNINIVEVLEEIKEVTSPLVQLDISSVITETPSELPVFERLPFLFKYNVSGNRLTTVGTRHFAGLCSLKTLDNTNVTVEEGNCECWKLNKWLTKRKVDFTPFVCEKKENECTEEVPDADLETYTECNREREEFNRRSRTLKGTYIAVGVIVPIVLIALLVYCRRRKEKVQKDNKSNGTVEEPLNHTKT